jgi:MSHA pilin protein MshD
MYTSRTICRAGRRGFTLIELAIAIVVIGVGVAGVLQVMNVATRSSADPQLQRQALAVAEAVLEEVELMPFTDCEPATYSPGPPVICNAESMGPESGEIRGSATSPFDNVNDYNGLILAPGTTDMNNSGLVQIPNGYTAAVAVATEGSLGPAGSLVPSGSALHITVTVTYGRGTVVLEGYRTKYAPTAPML